MVSIAAHAKINLGLEILHKRIDGYHEINTIFSRVSLHDTLHIESHGEISVFCPQLPSVPEQENLVWKAATALRRAYSVKAGAKITIEKHIPLGAGLGGGSSNAASALLALRKLWQLPCAVRDLHPIARMLGADVPFFLGNSDAIGKGIGEDLTPIALDLPYYVLLVFPGIEVSTPRAYSLLQRTTQERSATSFVAMIEDLASADDRFIHVRNDFESVVFSEYPILADIAHEMKSESTVSVFMSGSGSTLVALYRHREDALKQSARLKSVRSCVCTFIHTVNDEYHL